MTDQEYAEMAIPLLQAVAEGKTLEYRNKNAYEWEDRPNSVGHFDFICYEYRAKLDPRAGWRGKVHAAVQQYADAYSREDSGADMGAALSALDDLLNNIPKED